MADNRSAPGAEPLPRALRWLARLAEAIAATEPASSGIVPGHASDPLDPRRVGIVLVHGIGVQKPGATLLDWSGTLLAALAAWRMRLLADGTAVTWDPAGPWPEDGVVSADLHIDGQAPSTIEVAVPGVAGLAGAAALPQRWLITEAWWAANVEPPTLGQVADWTGRDGVLGRVVFGILGGQAGGIRRMVAPGLGLFISASAFLALLGYQFLRGVAALIPITSVKDALTARKVGNFLVDWWGDVYVLLRDPAQAANVRGTLATAIRRVRDEGCDAIVVVGHSGGTIVTYTTLSDPDLGDVAADTFISHGQAIKLARTIVDTSPPPKGSTSEDTPLGNLQTEPLGPRVTAAALREPLRVSRWHDFYASQDPATFGQPLEDCLVPGSGRETTRIVNRASVGEDHGEYWTNDEEFVVPVMREIDVAGLPGEASRFPASAPEAVARRRQRVAIRSTWRRASVVTPVAAILASVAYASPGIGIVGGAGQPALGLIGSMGHAVAQAIGVLPGADLVGGIVDAIHAAITGVAPGFDAAAGVLAAFALGTLLPLGVVAGLAPVRAWRPFTERGGRVLAGAADLLLSLLVLVAAVAAVAGWGAHLTAIPDLGIALLAGAVAGPIAIAAYALLVGTWDRVASVVPSLDDITTGIGILGLAFVIACVAWSATFDPGIQAWLLGVAAVAVVVNLVVRIGLSRWGVWDAHERGAARLRPDDPASPGRLRVLASGVVGLGVLIAIIDAVARGAGPELVVAVGVAVLFGIGLAITDVERAPMSPG